MESNPRPSDETNMAELMRLRVQRSEIDVERSSASMWMCCKIEIISKALNNESTSGSLCDDFLTRLLQCNGG